MTQQETESSKTMYTEAKALFPFHIHGTVPHVHCFTPLPTISIGLEKTFAFQKLLIVPRPFSQNVLQGPSTRSILPILLTIAFLGKSWKYTLVTLWSLTPRTPTPWRSLTWPAAPYKYVNHGRGQNNIKMRNLIVVRVSHHYEDS